jgi:hypothetical protein
MGKNHTFNFVALWPTLPSQHTALAFFHPTKSLVITKISSKGYYGLYLLPIASAQEHDQYQAAQFPLKSIEFKSANNNWKKC